MKFFTFFFFYLLSIGLFSQIPPELHNKAVDLVELSNKEIDNENYDLALSHLSQAYVLDSTIRDIFIAYYHLHYNLENTKEQISSLRKAISIHYDDDQFYYYLGKSYLADNNLDSAIENFSTAIKYSKINGEDFELVSDYYASRGICFLKMGEFNKSITDFSYAIKLDEYKTSALANRGVAYYKLKQNDNACESWKKALYYGEMSVEMYINKFCE